MVKALPGIYKIVYKHNGDVYYGQSINIQQRWISHRKLLKANKHGNKYLQRIYNKYGLEALDFQVVRFLDGNLYKNVEKEKLKKILCVLEQTCITAFECKLNLYSVAGSPLGFKHSEEYKQRKRELRLGQKHKEETKEKIRQSKIGVKRPKECIEKFSLSLSKPFYFYHSEKGEIGGLNLAKYARENKLNTRGLMGVKNGKTSMYKNHFRDEKSYKEWSEKKNSLSSTFRGVSLNKKSNRWRAGLRYKNETGKSVSVNLGERIDELEAAELALIGRQVYETC